MSARRGLILTASYGSGHNQVASTLARAFGEAGVETLVVDHFRELVHPQFDAFTRRLYYAMLRRTPALWGLAYWVGDQIPVSSPLLLGLTRLGIPKLKRLLGAERPDFVVSVHPTPSGALAELTPRGGVPPHTTVFTDWVSHTQWIFPHVDRYCVPAEEIGRDLIARGIPRDRVALTGVPVGAEFARPAEERAAARLRLGLSARLPLFLFMDGAGGRFGRLENAVDTLLGLEAPCQAVVLTGRGPGLTPRAAARIERRRTRIKVFGFVDNVRELMGTADFLVSKAGGVTLAEALAAELPMVSFGSLPGQECAQRALRGHGRRRPGRPLCGGARARAARRPRRSGPAAEPARAHPPLPPASRGAARGRPGPGGRDGAGRARVVRAAPLLGAGLAGWAGFCLGPHLARRAGSRHGRGGRRAVALTFDDGPDPIHTPRVLDILARAGVRATFFLIGRRAEAAAGLARRVADEGHELGNHTWSHRRLWLAGPGATRDEVERGHEAVTRAAGRPPRFFRAPWGLANLAVEPVLAQLGTPPVLWTIQPEGLGAVGPARQLRRSLARVEPGAIYDLHDADGVPGAGARLTAYLPRADRAACGDGGYALVPLGELV